MALGIQIGQIVLAVILLTLILIQSKGVGLSAAFGGGGEVFHTRRGAERVIFIFTIIVAFLFVSTSLINVWIQ